MRVLSHIAFLLILAAVPAFTGCATEADIAAWNAKLAEQKRRAAEEEAAAHPKPAARFEPRPHPATRDFETSLALPSANFDLLLSLLLFAKEYGDHPAAAGQNGANGANAATPPAIAGPDVDHWLAEVDSWSVALAKRAHGLRDLDDRIGELAAFIHYELGFDYDSADPNGYKLDNLMFDRVLARRKGYCVTLSMLYVVLAPAAGLELLPVRVPGHFAVSVAYQAPPIFLETTSYGARRRTDEFYVKHRMSVQSVEDNGVYLTPLDGRGVFSTIFSNLGAVESLAGEDTAALKHLNRAVELAPSNIEARYNRAGLFLRGGDAMQVQQVQDALADLNESIRLDPNFYYGFTRRAGLQARYGDKTKAAADLARAFALRPDLPLAHIEKGVMLYNAGDIEGAATEFEEALKLDPSQLDALRNLATIKEELGDPARAAALRETYERLRPKIRETDQPAPNQEKQADPVPDAPGGPAAPSSIPSSNRCPEGWSLPVIPVPGFTLRNPAISA